MKTNLLGLIEGMTNDHYHAGPGYSASDLITMADGFDLWKWKKAQPREPEPSDAMEVGTATHLLLEARIKNDLSLFHAGVAVLPEINMRTKDGKAAYEALVLGNAGKVLLSAEDHDMVQRMVDAVFREPEVVGYFRGGISEPSIFVKDAETGVLIKTRPDYLRPNDGLSINFKTMRADITFERQAAIMAYDWQSSFYMHVLEQHYGRQFDEIHVSVVKAKEGPCRVHVHTIDDDDLQFAKAHWKALLARIPECERTGIWPAPPVSLQSVRLPNFARKVNPYV